MEEGRCAFHHGRDHGPHLSVFPVMYLKFSHNWNNKLDCKVFTTLRIYDGKYSPGHVFEVVLKDSAGDLEINGTRYKKLGRASILLSYKVQVKDLTMPICLLDTGYTLIETRKILFTMYKNRKGGFSDHTMMVLAYLQWLDESKYHVQDIKPRKQTQLEFS